jgi:hypothetical protein
MISNVMITLVIEAIGDYSFNNYHGKLTQLYNSECIRKNI